jgi:hypothetical protein
MKKYKKTIISPLNVMPTRPTKNKTSKSKNFPKKCSRYLSFTELLSPQPNNDSATKKLTVLVPP